MSREQAAENRRRIVEVAGRLFRERGFDGIGVADLMKAAGLTHGGFYGHFRSKDDLAVEACGQAVESASAAWERWLAKGGEAPLAALLDRYLSDRHRGEPGQGCLFAALAADVARQDNPALRRVLTEGVRAQADRLAAVVPGASDEARRQRALASLSAMVGALVLARAVDDPALSDEILAAARVELATPADTA